MLSYKFIKSIITILHSEVSPRQVAGGVVLGSIIGITPFFALHNILIVFLVLILKVNIGAVLLSIAVFGLIGLLTDPIAHQIGYLFLVKLDFLTPFWTKLYNMPIVPFTRFNNTVVLGSLIVAIILAIPVFRGTIWFIEYYRSRWSKRVESLKIVKLVKLTSWYNLYDKIRRGE